MPPPPAAGPMPVIARRDFLAGSAAGLAMLAGSGAFAQGAPLPLKSYPTAFFTPEEWRFILAACDRLIPDGGEGPGALATRVPVFLDRDLSGPFGTGEAWYMKGPHDPSAPPEFGWQSPHSPAALYREALKAIEARCREEEGEGFAELSPEAQDRILTRLSEDDFDLAPELSGFWDLLLSHVKEGYFSDPQYGGNHGMAAWIWIGFPGARANFLEWVPRHNERYPLGPVSIRGERA